MLFPDKLTPIGHLEQDTNGEATERFVLTVETLKEVEAIRAALANVALLALQSESAMDPDDARILLDFMQTDHYKQGRLAVYSEQAERLARLIRKGGSSVMPEILQNQFHPREIDEANRMDDEELTRVAITVADTINIEVNTRKFRKDLDDASIDDLFGSIDEV